MSSIVVCMLQSLVNYLDCWTGEYRDDVSLKTAIMGFINAALKYGPGQVGRYEILQYRYCLT